MPGRRRRRRRLDLRMARFGNATRVLAGFASCSGIRGQSGQSAAVPLDASALLADPHRYVGWFQGLVHDFGQVVPDRVQVDCIF